MKRLVAVLLVALSNGDVAAKGGGGYVVIVPGSTPSQPGNACVAEGVASGQEAATSDGTLVLVKGVHGIHTARCPNSAFPLLASTQKLAPEETRNTPSVQCVPQGARAGDQVTIDFYGVATVLEVLPASDKCRFGSPANVVSAAAYRASNGAAKNGAAPSRSAPPREPTDAEIQKEYDRLFVAVSPVKQFHVRHILVRTREDAEAALGEIKAGKPFADVAARVSTDPSSSAKGGDLGWNVPSNFIEEFSATMVKLDPSGLAADPTRTRFGWHVIEVLETKVGKEWFPPLSAVKDRIAVRLKTMQAATRVPAKAVCRKMAPPEAPAAALREGVKGTVVAEMRVENGKVAEVLSLSGPSVFHSAVSDALTKYECDRLDRPVLATQSFDF